MNEHPARQNSGSAEKTPLPLVDVLVRQREAWEQGTRPSVESLLQTYPHLAESRDAVLDLIYSEIVLREQIGDHPQLAEYLVRFPHLETDLRLQFEVDDVLTEFSQVPPKHRSVGSTVQHVPNRSHDEALPRLEGCDILEEIGRGAMGVVYRGLQRAARRQVAVKVLSSDMPTGRVRNEAEAAARLQHPGVVQVFDVKEHEGHTALVLEYVEGGNLAQKLAGVPQSPRDSARIVEQMASAMAYAHERGVIHRDLKPSNVLLSGRWDMLLGQCSPKISDFGLAKLVEGGVALTQTSDILGTPSYMAPEQTGGPNAEVGPAADIYSLGAILYECLTGRPPFLGQSLLDTLDQVRKQEPVPPSRLQQRIPRDLEIITLKCLHKVPSRRYGSAQELQEDLHHFLSGEPIKARSVGWPERAWKWARLHPSVAALILFGVMGGMILLVVGLSVNAVLRHQRDIALNQADELDTQLQRTRQLLYTTQLLRVGSVWPTDPLQGLRMLEDPGACPVDLRCFSWRVLHAQCKRYRLSLQGHSAPITATALQPNGNLLACSTSDGRIFLWDKTVGTNHLNFKANSTQLTSIAFRGDGTILAGGGEDGKVCLWETMTGKLVSEFSLPPIRISAPTVLPAVLGLVWLPDHRTLAVSSAAKDRPGTVTLWDTRSPRLRRTLRGDVGPRSGVAISPNGHTIACGGRDHSVLVWDLRTGKQLTRLRGHTAPITALMFSPKGQPLVTGSLDGTLRTWDTDQETERDSLDIGVGGVASLSIHPTGQIVAVAGSGTGDDDVVPDIRLVDLVTRRKGEPFRGHPGGATAVTFSSDGNSLISGGKDRSVKIWDHPGPRTEVNLHGHTGAPGSVVMAGDGRTLAWISRGEQPGTTAGEISVYDLRRGAYLAVVKGHGRPVQSLAISADGQYLASAAGNPDEPAELVVWEVRTSRLVQVFTGHDSGVVALAFTPKGRELISAGQDGKIKIWNVANSSMLRQSSFAKNPKNVSLHTMLLASNGRRLGTLVKNREGTFAQIHLWDLQMEADGLTLARTIDVPGDTQGMAISPTGTMLAYAGTDGTVKIVPLESDGEGDVLSVSMKAVHSLAFSPDEKTLAVAGPGVSIQLWDVNTAHQRASLPGHRGGVCYVTFAGDGSFLFAATTREIARLWHAAAGR